MLFRNWLPNIAIAGCLIGACLWPHGLAAQDSPQQTEPATRSEPAPAQVIVPDASVLRSIYDDWVKRSAEEKAASEAREQRRERREDAELGARQGMERWAVWVFALLAGQLALGILAVRLLWSTFRETSRVAADTRAAFTRLEERPYVIPQDIGQLRRVMAAHDIAGGIGFKIANYGKVPAIVHTVDLKFTVVQMPLTPEKLAAPNCGKDKDLTANFPLSKTLPPGETHDFDVITVPSEMKAPLQFEGSSARMQPGSQGELFVVVRIEYDDVANGPLRRAYSVWRLGPEGFARYGGKTYNYETEIAG